METAPQRNNVNQHQSPPGPFVSSHVARRTLRRKEQDPFLQLGHPSSGAFTESPEASPTAEAATPEEPYYKRVRTRANSRPSHDVVNSLLMAIAQQKASLNNITHKLQVIVTPFLFVSFLISLFVVDTQNAISRTRNSSLFSFLNPDPYQDPSNSRWDRQGSSAHVEPPDILSPNKRPEKQKSWHLHKKIRKIARLEISDAFEMRGRVMVVMVIVMMLTICATWYSLRWMVSIFWSAREAGKLIRTRTSG